MVLLCLIPCHRCIVVKNRQENLATLTISAHVQRDNIYARAHDTCVDQRGSAWIYDVRMAQFVLKIEKLTHIMGPRATQEVRSPSLIMASDIYF